MINKLHITFVLFGIFIMNTTAQEFYWSDEKKIPLIVDDNIIVVKASGDTKIAQDLNGIQSIKKVDRISAHSLMVAMKNGSEMLQTEFDINGLNFSKIFVNQDGRSIIPTGEILFSPKEGITFKQINEFCRNELILVGSNYEDYTALVKDYQKIFQLANKLYESGLVKYSHPNFVSDPIRFQNDVLYPDQYYLNNTGQFGGTAGVDINAPQAWGITTGLSDVRVAVIDDGVENHEDLNGRVVSGYTAGGTGTGAPGIDVAHGQACAGIIAASRNNNIGIAGIAPCSDIVL